MAFRFQLQAVLRWRASYEDRERRRLEAVTRELINAREKRDESERERVLAAHHLQLSLHQGMIAAEMQFELAGDRARARQIASWNDQVAKLEVLRRRQLEIFEKVQQQRKILENLRDRQLAAYNLDQARRAQQQMDDRFLLTRANLEAP